MIVPGIKDLVRAAFEGRKFLTNGHALPAIDFSQPLHVQVSGFDIMDLVSLVCLEDDEVTQYGKEFTRTLYLQMSPECIYQEALVSLLSETPELIALLAQAKKLRICISGFTTYDGQTYRKREKLISTDPVRVHHRKLVLEESERLVLVA